KLRTASAVPLTLCRVVRPPRRLRSLRLDVRVQAALPDRLAQRRLRLAGRRRHRAAAEGEALDQVDRRLRDDRARGWRDLGHRVRRAQVLPEDLEPGPELVERARVEVRVRAVRGQAMWI